MKAILALIFWIIGVTYLSLVPLDPSDIQLFNHADKLAHFVFYAGMAFLILNAFTHDWKFRYISALLLCICYGILMENLQDALKAGRHFDNFDIIANIIGALAGSIMFYFKKN